MIALSLFYSAKLLLDMAKDIICCYRFRMKTSEGNRSVTTYAKVTTLYMDAPGTSVYHQGVRHTMSLKSTRRQSNISQVKKLLGNFWNRLAKPYLP